MTIFLAGSRTFFDEIDSLNDNLTQNGIKTVTPLKPRTQKDELIAKLAF